MFRSVSYTVRSQSSVVKSSISLENGQCIKNTLIKAEEMRSCLSPALEDSLPGVYMWSSVYKVKSYTVTYSQSTRLHR